MDTLPKYHCTHERLDCYRLLADVARWFHTIRGSRRQAHLIDQGTRASESAVLNLAEGCYRTGKDRAYHLRVAQGSAAETVAVLDLLSVPQAAANQQLLRRAVAMIQRLP